MEEITKYFGIHGLNIGHDMRDAVIAIICQRCAEPVAGAVPPNSRDAAPTNAQEVEAVAEAIRKQWVLGDSLKEKAQAAIEALDRVRGIKS